MLRTVPLEKKPVNLVRTSMKGVYTFPPPPAGFDIRKGSKENIEFGLLFPTNTLGRDRAGWTIRNRIASWPLAKARIIPDMERMPRLPVFRVPSYQSVDGMHQFNANGNWTGAAIGRPFPVPFTPDPWATVSAIWTVPTAIAPVGVIPRPLPATLSPFANGWQYSAWVGLDGLGEDGSQTNDVLQAGVSSIVDAITGEAIYFSWYEWYVPGADAQTVADSPYVFPIKITNVPVFPGDQVFATVSYSSNQDGGTVTFANLSRHTYFTLFLEPPTGAGFSGDSIEWIVERPGGPGGSLLPDFGTLTFTNIGGSTVSGVPINLDNALTLTFLDAGYEAGDLQPAPTAVEVNGYIAISYGAPLYFDQPPLFNRNGF